MADTAIAIDRLRLRGPQAARLASVAARALPGALERALADLGDVEVGGLRVVLDLDPAAYDDETLAVLWADLIRAEIVRTRAVAGTAAPKPGSFGPRGSASGSGAYAEAAPSVPTVERVATDARLWLATGPVAGARVPASVLALADPVLAREVASVLGAASWGRLVQSLDRLLPAVRLGAEAPSAGGAGPDGVAGGGPERVDHVDPAAAVAPPTADAATTDASDDAPPAAVGVPAQVTVLAELRAGEPGDLDPASVTRAAGLVLLYPWLADHCRLTESLHPGLDPVVVREAALATLLDDQILVDDPLVRLLAGRPDPLTDDRVDRAPLPRADEVAASAERVLAAFVALLPGFQESSPGFVREAWLSRLGVLDLDRDPVLLTAATHPLDVLLPMLPYPLGLVKLPWTRLLSMRFRP